MSISAKLAPLHLGATGELVPPAYGVAGWYRAGPEPGELGRSVIAGHVDSRDGPDVFARTVRYENPGQEFQAVRSFGRFTFGANNCDPAATDAYVLRSDEDVPSALNGAGFDVRFFPGFAVHHRPSPGTP